MYELWLVYFIFPVLVVSFDIIFSSPIVSVLGVWAIQPLGLDPLDNFRVRFLLVAWASNCISHWLVIPRSFVPRWPSTSLGQGSL